MSHYLRIALAQSNLLVGDVRGNADKIIASAQAAKDHLGADIVVFPELTLTGYPPEDLLLRNDFFVRIDAEVERLRTTIDGIDIVIGLPWRENDKVYNAAMVIGGGQIKARYFKHCLPNYSVFDECRYFDPGHEPVIFERRRIKIGLTICEDLWRQGPAGLAAEAGAQIILNLNASPFHVGKTMQREAVIRQRIAESGCAIVYVNQVGGQDELVFDGESTVYDRNGTICQRLHLFKEDLSVIEFDISSPDMPTPMPDNVAPVLAEEEAIYNALVLGVRDYVEKNGFAGAVIGLSGGIDSALTLAIAVDALGADRVEAVMMPTQYTAQMSQSDAQREAIELGVDYHVVPISKHFNGFVDALQPLFKGMPQDTTEENIQARCRGLILMAISNKTGKIVLATGNKSEMSVGYATLYGDMCGGFAPIKDVPKTMVYRLARYRNRHQEIIPQRVIERPPSAELRPDQKDEDSLPQYEVLDPILERYIEHDQSVEDIIGAGFEEDVVKEVIRMVDRNEYKRRQAAPGVRITSRAFGRDRRYPITSGYGK